MDEINGKNKSRQFLTNDEMWLIYKFCIENHCLSQNGEAWKFRVHQTVAADEVNSRGFLKRKITSYHINKAVMEVLEWEHRFNKFPEPQETMEMDQLKVQHIKDINEIERLKLLIVGLQEQVTKLNSHEINNKKLQDKISKAVGYLTS